MKSSLLILSLLISTGLIAQKGDLNLSKWHLHDNVEASDYQLIKKTELYYFLSNDNDNIYIDMKIEDPRVQDKILKEGLIIWINMDGKTLKKMGVRYPIGAQSPTPLTFANTIELIGFTNEQKKHFPSENPDNFRGSVRYDDEGILYYKMIMPIAKLPIRNSKEGNGAMPFILGIEYGFSSSLHTIDNSRGRTTELHWIKNVKLATSK